MRSFVVVAVGGAIGAIVRWFVAEVIAGDPAAFPWATLIVNVVGCLAIGVAAARLVRDSILWDGAVVGLIGGLTTFSAFAVETRALVDADRMGQAFAYVVVSVLGGVAATEIARNGTQRR